MATRDSYLLRQHSYIRLEESDHPGCIWGLLRLLNYQNVKKMLPHKKHGTNTRSTTSKDVGNKKASGGLKNVSDEANPVSAEWANPPQTSSASKKSIKARIRGLMAKEDSSRCRVSDLPEQIQPHKSHVGNTVHPSSSAEDVEDILEIFKVNKQIFLKLLKDHDLARVNQFIQPNTLHTNARLTKSGSFPTLNSASMSGRGPSKLEDKHREIWPVFKDKDSEPSSKSGPMLHENSGDGSQVGNSKAKFGSMRRASSLNESVDRYAQLYSSTFNKEVKRHMSRSLKLVAENDEPAPRFRRRLSLPECDYESFLPGLEASRDAVECGPESIKDSAMLEVNTKGNSSESTAGKSCEDVLNKALNEEMKLLEQKDVTEGGLDSDAQDIQSLVLECAYEEVMGIVDFRISGDYEKAENPETRKTGQILPTELVDEEHNPELDYVKLVLELSGFTAKEQNWVWYTVQQPLDPAVFEEIEKHYCPSEQQKCSTEMEENKWDRKLIFDLINEALMEIDERSCLYYPKALSFGCHVLPVPKGHRLVEEVWVFVRRCLSWRPELNPMLDFAVAEDLHARHGWMNLQLESECVALELEDMILEELLFDEILVACS